MCGEVARPVPAVRRLVVTPISFAQPIRATTNTAHDRSECARDLKRTALAVGYFGHTSPPSSLTPKSTSGIIAQVSPTPSIRPLPLRQNALAQMGGCFGPWALTLGAG